MAVLCKSSRFLRSLLNKNVMITEKKRTRSIRVIVQEEKKSSRSFLKMSLVGAVVGTTIGAGYAYRKIEQDRKHLELEGKAEHMGVLKQKPAIQPSRTVISPVDSTQLKLTLFQYQSCPFCCKVRTFLDYYGISYDVVEVNPLFRNEIKWSPYKKVPILLAKVDGGYLPLNDSSVIVSVLASYLTDKNHTLDELIRYYPTISMNENGKFKQDTLNKYFLMYQSSLPKDQSLDDITEERKWRQWTDDVLVHTLSPNVYRTLGEAYQTFQWFSDVGKWDEYFPTWERKIMMNVGAWAMWIIGKRLKKKHNLEDDVRQSLYGALNKWLDGVKVRGGTFMGGSSPNLSDLAVFGVLRSLEGCDAFKDALEHTNLGSWYFPMKEQVKSHRGAINLAG